MTHDYPKYFRTVADLTEAGWKFFNHTTERAMLVNEHKELTIHTSGYWTYWSGLTNDDDIFGQSFEELLAFVKNIPPV